MCKGYYSPRIKKEYIQFLYYLARHLGVPMTHLVNEIVGHAVESVRSKELQAEFEAIKAGDEKFAEITTYLNSLLHSRSGNSQTRNKIVKMFHVMKEETQEGGGHDCLQGKG